MKKTTEERVTSVIEDKSGVKDFTKESLLIAGLGMDSLDMVELTMALEDEFEIEPNIPDEDAEKWKTVADVIEYITADDVKDVKKFVKVPYDQYEKVTDILERWISHRLHAVDREKVVEVFERFIGLEVE